MNKEIIKDPQAVLDYQWKWTDWLALNDTIATATVTVPAGITLDSQSNTALTVTAWLSGGTDRKDYDILCHIETNQGRHDDRTITIVCRDNR